MHSTRQGDHGACDPVASARYPGAADGGSPDPTGAKASARYPGGGSRA